MPFSNEIVDGAWKRSGGKCECTRPRHGHTGRCNQPLQATAKADMASSYGWKVNSVSGVYKNLLADCEILCIKCFKAVTETPTKK